MTEPEEQANLEGKALPFTQTVLLTTSNQLIMKLLLAALSLLFLRPSNEPLLVVDKDLKKPPAHASEFTTQQYLQRLFPVYEADVQAVVETTDKAVKWIDKEQACHSSTKLTAARTTFLLEVSCKENRKINVVLVTQVEETNTSFSFALARNEEDLRKVQRKLLDFATYLEQ